MAATVDLKELIENGVHFGHKTCSWNPKMAPYIYGQKRDLHIHNLLKTRPLLQKALNEIEVIAANNGKILFVSTKRAAQEIVEKAAARCEMPSVNKRWPGGMLTNFKTILRSVKKMKDLEGFIETEAFAAMKKKERLSITRELGKLQASFNGIRDMTSLPDMLFIIDVGHEHIAVKEAKKLGIPIVGIVDTNCSPEHINHVVPGNDDSQKAINLYARLVADTIDVAREKIRAKLKAAEIKMEGKTKVKVVKKSDSDVEVQKADIVESASEKPGKVEVVKKEAKSEKSDGKIIKVSAVTRAKVEKKVEAKKPTVKSVAKKVEVKKSTEKTKKASSKTEQEKS